MSKLKKLLAQYGQNELNKKPDQRPEIIPLSKSKFLGIWKNLCKYCFTQTWRIISQKSVFEILCYVSELLGFKNRLILDLDFHVVVVFVIVFLTFNCLEI